MITNAPPSESKPSLSDNLPQVQIGWITVDPCAPVQPGEPTNAAAERLITHLRTQFPEFDWHIQCLVKRLRSDSIEVDPLELLELGLGEKIERGWDFALVITGSELRARKPIFTIGVPSSALETAVMTTARFPQGSADTETRLAALAQFFLGQLLGLEPHEPGAMRRPGMNLSETLELFDAIDQKAMRARLHEVADSRLEERRPTLNRIAFRLNAFLADPRGILADALGYQPWCQPFRLSRLTAAAFASTLLLFLGEEAWKLGIGMNPGILAVTVGVAVIVSTAFLYRGQNLHLLTRRAILSEQLARSHLVLSITLSIGMISLWTILFLAALLVANALPAHVLSSWFETDVEPADFIKFAAFSATVGTLVGALGGNMEDEDDFKAEFLFDEES